MATNLDIITTAFRIINIINENEPPSSELAAEGLEAMNDLLADWEADGIELGYFPQTVLADTSPIEDKDLRGVKFNLAGELAGRKGSPISAASVLIAQTSFERLSKGTSEIIENSFDHLPSSRRAFDINNA